MEDIRCHSAVAPSGPCSVFEPRHVLYRWYPNKAWANKCPRAMLFFFFSQWRTCLLVHLYCKLPGQISDNLSDPYHDLGSPAHPTSFTLLFQWCQFCTEWRLPLPNCASSPDFQIFHRSAFLNKNQLYSSLHLHICFPSIHLEIRNIWLFKERRCDFPVRVEKWEKGGI